MQARILNLYLSRSWTHGDSTAKILKLLDNEPDFHYRASSVSAADVARADGRPDELRCSVRHALAHCHVALVLVGASGLYMRWLNEELDLSASGFKRRIPVLGIMPFGPDKGWSPFPAAADRMVSWNRAEIVSAIRGLSSVPLKPRPGGSPRLFAARAAALAAAKAAAEATTAIPAEVAEARVCAVPAAVRESIRKRVSEGSVEAAEARPAIRAALRRKSVVEACAPPPAIPIRRAVS